MSARDWWRGAVVYHVYPRSFRDSDGDGVGDLPGVLAGLDHIAALGVDAVWLSPFFRSPMRDFGYDVSDYCAVDPLFGTLADFDRIIERAHALGLKVLIDQVWSHTSDRHPWFLESCAARHGPKADWYVWADPRGDGTAPNNWLSVFGGPAWRWDPRRRQYYLHHFLSCQPALNLANPQVVEALMRAGEFWLGRGVDGFRLDAVDFLAHDPGLADNPLRPSPDGPPVNPFRMQDHLNDMARPETLAVMERIRALMDRYPGRTTIAELSSEADPTLRAADYTGANGRRLHMAYTLRLMRQPFTARAVNAAIAEVEARIGDGWMCWAFSNHDVARAVSRWGDGSPAFARLLMALLLSLRGSPCIYQGEELGLPEATVPPERLQDPYGINFHPVFAGRDGCRTPLPWHAGAPHGGFTTGEPWLPLPDSHRALAVAAQAADPHSTLAAYRRFLAWRKHWPELATGGLVHRDDWPRLIAFERLGEGRRLLCLFNPEAQPARLAVGPQWRDVPGHGMGGAVADGTAVLPPLGAAFAVNSGTPHFGPPGSKQAVNSGDG